MKKFYRYSLLITLFLVIILTTACSRNSENEHLPEYCQTYAGFTSIASKDFYDLLREQSDIEVNRFEYIEAISQISLQFNVDDPYREIDLSGIQCFQNLTNLTLIGRSFKDLSPISALSNIQSIELNGTSVVSIDSFKNLSKIKSLVISDTRTLQSVTGIEEMTKLVDLDLSGNGIVVIDGLNNLVNLETLYLNDNDIVIFPSINQLRLLNTLDISDNNINQLGADLSGLVSLTNLNAKNNDICDLSTLDDLISLKVLNLSNNDLGCVGPGISPNFDSLENAPNLEKLYLDDNSLTSIEGLRGRDINLKELYINDNNLTDITPISEYTSITNLVLYNNNITNINDLSGMTGLSNINLSNNNISNFSDLITTPNLVTIDLSFNKITAIPDISDFWVNLSILNISSNLLTDTSGVGGHPTIESLIIYNNGLTELSGISNMPELENLVIFDEPLELEINVVDRNPNYISIIRDSFNNLESLDLQENNVFDFGFELGNNIEIYNSINGLTDIAIINFTNMDINVIDNLSINLSNLQELNLDKNNITDISFILGNPKLEILHINNNIIGNLEVISGINTTDLDNLEYIHAKNISTDNNLINSFTQLPSILFIDLSNTSIVSIRNSFNDLSTLKTIYVGAENLLKVEDSFNSIYGIYNQTNNFKFESGKIGIISNSFNNGLYNSISIRNQSTAELTTIIEDSFNNIEVRGNDGIVIENNDFATISGSFNNIVTDTLSVSANKIEIISNSFIGSTINGTLDLSKNSIESVPSLNQVMSVEKVDLNRNVLTSLNFIDSILGITALDISDQQDKTTFNYTLTSIDGINNMDTLITLITTNNRITSIDGLRNLGITSFQLSYADNNNNYITAISPTSFIGTPLTTLDLDEYTLEDIAFLDNLEFLENLYIGINVPDLSYFQGQDFESTLEVLVIENSQNTVDFSFLANYDVVTNFTFTSPATTTINRLDGMESLASLGLDFKQITTISNSFNDLPDLNVSNTYLEQYSVLQSISNSFDIYGDTDHSGNATIAASIVIANSFNNLEVLNVLDNDGYLVPNFDILSFDSIKNIVFEHGNYNSLSFLNGYEKLSDITFVELDVPITDLDNNNVINLIVLSAATSIDTFSLDLNSDAHFDFTSLKNGQITLNGNFINYNFNALSADIIINSTAPLQVISGDVHDLTIDSISVGIVELHNYTSQTTTFNINSLTSVYNQNIIESNATTFTINTLGVDLDISIQADDLIINDIDAISYTIDNEGGAVVINNLQPELVVTITAANLAINNNTLEQVTLDGTVGFVTIDSTRVNTVNTSTCVITTLSIHSNQEVMTISGSNIGNLNLTNNLLNDLTVSINNADLSVSSTNNELLNAFIIANGVTFIATNIPSIVLSDATSISSLDLSNTGALSLLTYGEASVSTIEVITEETELTILGSTSIMKVSGIILDYLTIDSPLSSIEVQNSGTILDINVNVDSILFDNTTLTTLNMDVLSQLSLLRIVNSATFSTLNSNDANIDYFTVFTNTSTLNIDAINSRSNIIEGFNLTSITADLGLGSLSLDSINDETLDFNITVGDMTFGSGGTTNTTNLSINSLSTINELIVNASDLNSITAGTAAITELVISDASSDLDIIGTEILSITIRDSISYLDIFANLTTNLDVNSSIGTGLDITTNTSSMNLTAVSNVNIVSSTLENITFNLGVNDIEFILNKENLEFTIDGTANNLTITGTDVDSIVTTNGTVISTLNLDSLNIDELNFTTGIIENLTIKTLVTSMTIIGDEVRDVLVDGPNLTTLTASSSYPTSSLVISTGDHLLNLDADFKIIDLTNNNMTTLNLAGTNSTSLILQANNLSSVDTGNSISEMLQINTLESIFTINTAATNIQFTGNIFGTLNLIYLNTDVIELNTNTDILNVTSNSSRLSIDGTKLNQINGDLVSASVSNTTGVLTFDLTVTGLLEINNDTVTSILFDGGNIINMLKIKTSSATDINTNTEVVNSLKYEAVANNTTITSNSNVVELSTSGNSEITLNYSGTTMLNLQANDLNIVFVNLLTASLLDIAGEVTLITISGVNINTVTTELLTVFNKLTMNNTLIDSLDFISTELLVNIDTIEVNTLSNTNIETIMTIIDNSTINLISPIVDLDVYNFYYNTQLNTLTNQESNDSTRYDNFRFTAVNTAWEEILINQYMAHLNEVLTKAEIEAQVYQSAEEYFTSYKTDAGLFEADFTSIERQTIINDIQETLDQSILVISEAALNAQVITAIILDSTTYAISEQTNDTFTLS